MKINVLIFPVLIFSMGLYCGASDKNDTKSELQQISGYDVKITKMEPLAARENLRKLGITFDKKSFFDSIVHGDISAVQLFLKCGMSPDASGEFDEHYTTALSLAINKGWENIAIVLIENGANVNGGGNDARPLLLSTVHGMKKLTKLLIKKGAALENRYFNGHRYNIFMAVVTWEDAEESCRELGGYLACVESAEENEFLSKMTEGIFLWLGGTNLNKEKKWRWVNGKPFKYTNWQMGQPNNEGGNEHFLAMCPDGGWNDLPLDPKHFIIQDVIVKGYICEWDN